MTVIRVFTAFVIVLAIVTIAVVLATWTPDAGDNDEDERWPRVPDEQMRIIDAALPADQMDAKRAQLIEEGVAQ